MSVKFKKALALLCCVVLMLTVTACGGNQSSTPNSSAPDQPDKAGSKVENTSSTTGDEPVKLTIFKEGTRPINDKTETIRQQVIKDIGVDMEMNQIGENAAQQLALMITSNEMPDLMLLSFDTYLEYARQGAFTDISADLANYENLQNYAGDHWSSVTVNGAIYGVPSLLPYASNHGTVIRKDWLDNLNLEVPKTLEDWENVMRAFTFDDPDGNGQKDTYGYFGLGFSYTGPILGAFGAAPEQLYFLNDDGTVTTNAISDNYRDGLAYLNKLYEEGIIDPEIFTADGDQAYQKWCRNEYGIWNGWWSFAGNAYLRFGFEDLHPEAEVVYIDPPTGSDGTYGELYANPVNGVVAISGSLTPEKKEAALKLLDYNASTDGFYTLMWGIRDVDYETDENNVITWYWGFEGKDRNGEEVTDMELYKLLYNEPLQRVIDGMGTDKASQLYAASTKSQEKVPSREDLLAFTRTDEYLEYNAELQKYFEENSIRFIMGEKDIETEWEQYKSEYLAMGGEKVRQSLLKAYNENFGTDYTFAE